MSYILALIVLILPPCADESDSNCYWDASVQGNGSGHSFVDVKGKVFYID